MGLNVPSGGMSSTGFIVFPTGPRRNRRIWRSHCVWPCLRISSRIHAAGFEPGDRPTLPESSVERLMVVEYRSVDADKCILSHALVPSPGFSLSLIKPGLCATKSADTRNMTVLNLPRLKSRDSCFIDRCHCWSYTVSTGVASGSSCRTD